MNTAIWFFIGIGTIILIFQNQVINFLFKYCHFEKMADLDIYFLSANEKERKKYEQYVLSASPKELKSDFDKIISECAGKYNNRTRTVAQSEVIRKLPQEIIAFFDKNDFLVFKKHKIIDIKKLSEVIINNKHFFIIGEDREAQSVFMVACSYENAGSEKIYEQNFDIGPNSSRCINFIEDSQYNSFCNFVCFMYSYYNASE